MSKSKAILIAIYALFAPLTSFADVTEIEAINFGQFTITDNQLVHTLTIEPDGSIVADPVFFVIDNGKQGEYSVTGFPNNTVLIITFGSTNLVSTSNPSHYFTLSNFQTSPATVETDAGGAATFTLGGDLKTSANGINYISSPYTATLTISVNY
jgi:hypothetical protein